VGSASLNITLILRMVNNCNEGRKAPSTLLPFLVNFGNLIMECVKENSSRDERELFSKIRRTKPLPKDKSKRIDRKKSTICVVILWTMTSCNK
jgi:hypothetical protein